jgi:hypothetical protein
MPAETSAGVVVRVDLPPGEWAEWALAVRPAGPQPAEPARPSATLLPRRFAIVRVPGAVGQVLGRAVLLHGRRQTMICCHEDHISDRAAIVLSALLGHALSVITDDDAGGSSTEPGVTITRVEHQLRPADDDHLASADLVPGRTAAFKVCAEVISAELAGVLGLLCTAYARTLRDLGRPCAEILAANDQ